MRGVKTESENCHRKGGKQGSRQGCQRKPMKQPACLAARICSPRRARAARARGAGAWPPTSVVGERRSPAPPLPLWWGGRRSSRLYLSFYFSNLGCGLAGSRSAPIIELMMERCRPRRDHTRVLRVAHDPVPAMRTRRAPSCRRPRSYRSSARRRARRASSRSRP